MLQQRTHRILSTFFLAIALPLGALALGATPAQARGGEADELRPATRSEPWSAEVLELFRTFPVQDGGRIKPLDTLAGLRLLTLNGRRTLNLDKGRPEAEAKADPRGKLSAMEWLLDCFFYPEQARTYPCFRVEYGAVLTNVGVTPKQKRDWYSYEELEPGFQKLFHDASQYVEIERRDRTVVQQQTLKLASDVRTFQHLTSTMVPLTADLPTTASPELAEVFAEDGSGTLSSVLRNADAVVELARSQQGRGGGVDGAVDALFAQMSTALGRGGLAFMPPPESAEDQETWWSIVHVAEAAFEPHSHADQHVEWLAALERLARNPGDGEAFRSELESLETSLLGSIHARGEYEDGALEVSYNAFEPFYKALLAFVFAFVLAAMGWLMPDRKWLWRTVWALTALGAGLVVAGIWMRCIIRDRPPIVSLYDTIIFITGSIALVAMFMEVYTRQRMMLSLGALLGAAGMFLAGRFELKEVESAGDTMASVVAVLDTNYYLAIHVVTINLGYAGGLLASGIAHVWLLGKLFGFKKGDKAFYKSIIRMVYGVVCFGLLFSIFGTIMGGVWANDSWGRFWGWDPKENGALLICIWFLIMLHGRLGGYLRDRGIAVCAVIGGVVVTLSWWGVNLLEVGLHSYGFTSGVAMILFGVWATEAAVLAASGLHAALTRGRVQSA